MIAFMCFCFSAERVKAILHAHHLIHRAVRETATILVAGHQMGHVHWTVSGLMPRRNR